MDYRRASNVLISRQFTTVISRNLFSNKQEKTTEKHQFTFSPDQQRNQSRVPAFIQTFRRQVLVKCIQFKTSDAFNRTWHRKMCSSNKDDGTATRKEIFDLKKKDAGYENLSFGSKSRTVFGWKKEDRKYVESLTCEQKLKDALEAFNSNPVKEAESDMIAKQLEYEEVMLENLNAFKDNSVQSHTCSSKHLPDNLKLESIADDSENFNKKNEMNKQFKYEEVMLENLNAFKDNSVRSQTCSSKYLPDNLKQEHISDASENLNKNIEIGLPSKDAHGIFNRKSNDSKTSVEQKVSKITNVNIVPATDTELKNTVHSVFKETHFSFSLQTRNIPKTSVLFRKPTKDTNSFVLFTVHGRTKKRETRSKSSPGEILQMLLSKEEQKILRQMIETEVRKQMNGSSCKNGSNECKSHDTKKDSKIERDIENLSQEILVNLMAQVLKHALIKHKLNRWTKWIKERKNQKRILRMLLSFIVFILRFKSVAGLILPDAVDSLATVEMISSFTMGSDLEAEFKSKSLIDVGKFQDGKSIAFTSTTTFEVVPGEKSTDVK